jgi:hypothetical protein
LRADSHSSQCLTCCRTTILRRQGGGSLPFHRRLRFEPLEDRRLLSITVDTLVDEADGSIIDGDISLRDAIALASAGETIDFAVTGTINLSIGTTNFDRLLTISKGLTINGPGANLLTINAFDPTPASNNGDGSRVFNIDDGTSGLIDVAIIGLTLTGADNGDSNTAGGAISSSENLTIRDSVITGNAVVHGTSRGGGIANFSGALNIERTTISDNSANDGGGVFVGYGGGTLNLTDSTISGNQATFDGGGIFGYFASTMNVVGSTISGNDARRFGGGITLYHSNLSVRHSTISANRADSDGVGGGFAGGLRLIAVGSTATLDHAIVAGNFRGVGTTRDDINGQVTAQFSLIGDNTGATIIGANNLINEDPELVPLADNGGSTKTHALSDDSPAIDAGDPSFDPIDPDGDPMTDDAIPFDQRGAPFIRVFDDNGAGGAGIDMGAYERQIVAASDLIVDTLADENDDDYSLGDRSLREAIGVAIGGVGAETITFAAALTSGGPATILLTLGELAIRDDLTINGPSANLLTIDAGGNDPTSATNNGDGSRVFNIDNGDSGTLIDVELIGLTLTGGDASSSGGAILTRENLTIADSVITGNATATTAFYTGGGGIYSNAGFTAPNSLTVRDSSLSANSSANEGGGIRKRFGSLVVERSTISGNTSTNAGGGISAADGGVNVQIRDSTISGNVAGSGGGVFLYATSTSTTITGSTISGNTAMGNGGGIESFNSNLTVRHSTIASNRADSDSNSTGLGGGLFRSGGTVLLGHAIVANNQQGSLDNDIHSALVGTANFSLMEIVSGVTLGGSGNVTGLDPQLGPLAENGGPTMTHSVLAGSPAIDSGDPAAVAGVGDVPEFDQRGTSFSRVVQGRIDIGAFETRPASVVDTLVDENDGNYGAGDLSLREALAITDPDGTITFAVTGTINLTNLGQLTVDRGVTIDGPGANLLTVNAFDPDLDGTNDGDGSRVFLIDDGNSTTLIDVELIGLTLTGGDASSSGGAIFTRENLTIANSVITGNHTATTTFASGGGGIYSGNPGAVLTVRNSTLSGNSSANEGGGIRNRFGSLVVERSTIDNNSAASVGGGISAADNGVSIQILDSSIFGNLALGGGGAFLYAALPTITNTTISGNMATGNGGGIEAWNSFLAIRHSTIASNRADSDVNATGQGGGIYLFGNNTLELGHTIVANNQQGNSNNDIHSTVAQVETASFSLTEVVSGVTLSGTGNITGVDPLLGSLADNGGPTMTHSVLAGSPTIDSGDPAAVAGVGDVPEFDQRGSVFARVSGGRIDIGAFEVQIAGPALPGDYNENGIVDAADYVLFRKYEGTNTPLANDAIGGVIGPAHYEQWTANFGESLPGAGAGSEEQVGSVEGGVGSGERETNEERGATEVQIADFGLRIGESEESRVKGQEPERTSTGSWRWREDALVAWVASQRSGGEGRDEEAVEIFARREGDVSGGSIRDAIDSVFEKLLTDVG